MDYKQEIKELKEELKDFDVRRLGQVANENKPKTQEEKRKICLLGAYEELLRIENLNKKEQESNIKEIDEGGEPYDKTADEENREPLSIEKTEVFKILLSWGGGEDGFKLTFKDKELLGGVYYMADWGEYQEQKLSEDEAQEVFNFYMFGEYPEIFN